MSNRLHNELRPGEQVIAEAWARGPERPWLTIALMMFFVIPGVLYHELFIRRYRVLLTDQRLLIAPAMFGDVMSWERSNLPPFRVPESTSWAQLHIDAERPLRLRFWRFRRGGNWRDGYRVVLGLLGRDASDVDTYERGDSAMDWLIIATPILYFTALWAVLTLWFRGTGKG